MTNNTAAAANNLCIVDDDEAVRRSLGLLLLSRGYAVQTFASGEAFLEGTDLQRAGCVILDLRLGGMSGLQVFDALRAQDSPLVVIFLSGHGDIPVAVEAVQNGAFGWLEKPCNDERLLDTIARALQQAGEIATRRQARQAAQALWDKLTPALDAGRPPGGRGQAQQADRAGTRAAGTAHGGNAPGARVREAGAGEQPSAGSVSAGAWVVACRAPRSRVYPCVPIRRPPTAGYGRQRCTGGADSPQRPPRAFSSYAAGRSQRQGPLS